MTTKDQRILGFDGLRALAFLMVFVSHKMPTVRTDAVGTAGVWLFFVLSGFLITRILARFRERIETGSESVSGALSAFYLSRTARIMPVYYAFLAVLSILAQLGHIELGEKGRQLSYWLFVTNIYIEQNGWQTDLGHLWSLAVEEQFYLAFAPLVLLIARQRLPALCMGLVAANLLAFLILWARGSWSISFYVDTIANVGLLALGGLAGLVVDRSLPSWLRSDAAICLVLAAFLAVPVAAAHSVLWPTVGRLTGILAALLLVQVAQGQKRRVVRLLDMPWIREIGLVSYGAYLFHPVIHAGQLLPVVGIHVDFRRSVTMAIELGLTLILAELSWRLFERPVRAALLRTSRPVDKRLSKVDDV
jgi:peptidoglycan/LPS O-acetylase OafA/YrhL